MRSLHLHLTLFALCLSAPALSAQRSDSLELHQAHLKWFDGLLAEDTVRLSAVLAHDVTLAFPGGNIMPRSEFLAYLQKGQLYYDTAEHHDTRIRLYRGAAVVNGSSTLTYRFQGAAGSERLTYTATYVFVDGHWRMVAWQSTVPMRQQDYGDAVQQGNGAGGAPRALTVDARPPT